MLITSMEIGFPFTSSESEMGSRTISFDQNWHFMKGDPSDAESPSFNDSGRRQLDLPHDWINGRHVRTHSYGYTSLWYDITPYLNPAGESNVVAVQVKNEGIN